MNGGDKTIVGTITDTPQGGRLPEDLYISLEVTEGPDQGVRHTLSKTHTVLGRGDVDIKLNDPTVSGTHASIDYVGTEIMIVDLQSSNGTMVNGEKVEKTVLGNMDEIKLGNSRLFVSIVRDVYGTYSQEEAETAPAPAEREVMAVDPNEITSPRHPFVNPALDPTFRALLFVLQGPDKGTKFLIAKQSTVVGRGDGVDFQLNDLTVSRRHCQIAVRSREFMGIKDLASTNSTYLNGKPVSAVQIKHNDVLQLGDSMLRFIIMDASKGKG